MWLAVLTCCRTHPARGAPSGYLTPAAASAGGCLWGTPHSAAHTVQSTTGRVKVIPTSITHTVYRVIFAPYYFRPSTLANGFALLKFTNTIRLCTQEIPWNIGICPELNSLADNEGERGENKMDANISLYTVLIICILLVNQHRKLLYIPRFLSQSQGMVNVFRVQIIEW